MKLVVGLGNPGDEYKNTKHNVGFSLLDCIASKKNLEFSQEKFNAKYLKYYYNDELIFFIKPLSYMNLSGGVVKKFVDFYKISSLDVFVIQDDLDMRLGRVKIVYNSSSGGHNGIKDIEKSLGTKLYTRLKIGIGNNKDIDTKDYVLGNFSAEELKLLNDVYEGLVDVIEDFCDLSYEMLTSKYNRK